MEVSRTTINISSEIIDGLNNNNAQAIDLLKSLVALKTGQVPTKSAYESFDNNILVSFELPDNKYYRLSISNSGIDIIVSEYTQLPKCTESKSTVLEAFTNYPELCKVIYNIIVSNPEDTIIHYLKLFESITGNVYSKYSYTTKDNFIAIGLANESGNESLIMLDSNGKFVYHFRDYK